MRRPLALLLLAACGDNGVIDQTVEPEPVTPVAATCSETDVVATLRALPHVTRVVPEDCGDYVFGTPKCFSIEYQQPIQHANPSGPSFTQHLFLVHRGCDRPMMVGDWGYSQEYFFDDELTVLYRTNVLWIEHRYQGKSVPTASDWDWSALTIENGAADMHEIITSFRQHYGANFVSTGASKGGITATYHHYLYPDDLDGTIPYVAPASRSPIDSAYQTYLTTYFPPCAQQLRDAQVAALSTRRTAMQARLSQFVDPGFEPLLLEYYVAHYDWSFWQYYGVQYCSQVPTASSTDDQFFNFFFSENRAVAAPAEGDEERSDGALSYEWLTQQGFALQLGAHVKPHITQPVVMTTMEDSFREAFPDVTLPAYNGRLTWAVRKWARDHADNMLLIYGQYDPWSGGAMEEPKRPTSARFFVPNATHGAQISRLRDHDEAAALAHATRMFGVPPTMTMRADAQQAGDNRIDIMAVHERKRANIATKLLTR